jgi:hypothetical protein
LAPDQRQLVCLWQFGALALGVHGQYVGLAYVPLGYVKLRHSDYSRNLCQYISYRTASKGTSSVAMIRAVELTANPNMDPSNALLRSIVNTYDSGKHEELCARIISVHNAS